MDKHKHCGEGSRPSSLLSSKYHNYGYSSRSRDSHLSDHNNKSPFGYLDKMSSDLQYHTSSDINSPGSQKSSYSYTSNSSIAITEDDIEPYMVIDMRAAKRGENDNEKRFNGNSSETDLTGKESNSVDKNKSKKSKWKNAFAHQPSTDTEVLENDNEQHATHRQSHKKNDELKSARPENDHTWKKIKPYVVEDIRVSSDDEKVKNTIPITRISGIKIIERGFDSGLYSDIELPKEPSNPKDTILTDRTMKDDFNADISKRDEESRYIEKGVDLEKDKKSYSRNGSRTPSDTRMKERNLEKEYKRRLSDTPRTRRNSGDSDRRSSKERNRKRSSGNQNRRRHSGTDSDRRRHTKDRDKIESSSRDHSKRRTSSETHHEKRITKGLDKRNQHTYKDLPKSEEETIVTTTSSVVTPEIAGNLQFFEQQLAAMGMQDSTSSFDPSTQKVLMLKYQQAMLAQNINTLCMLNQQQAAVNYFSNPGVPQPTLNLMSPSTNELTASLPDTPSPISTPNLVSSLHNTPSPIVTPNLKSSFDVFNFVPPPPSLPSTNVSSSHFGSKNAKSSIQINATTSPKSPKFATVKKQKSESQVTLTDKWKVKKEKHLEEKCTEQHQQQKSHFLLRNIETSTDNMTIEQLLLRMKKYQNKLSIDELVKLKNALDKKVENTRKLKEELKLKQSQKQHSASKSASTNREQWNSSVMLKTSSQLSSKFKSKSKVSSLPDLNLPFVEQALKKNPLSVKPQLQSSTPKVIPRGILLKEDASIKTELDNSSPPPPPPPPPPLLVPKPKSSSKEKSDGRKLSFKEYQKRKTGGSSEVDGKTKSIEDEYVAFLMSIGDGSNVKEEEDKSKIHQQQQQDHQHSFGSDNKRNVQPPSSATYLKQTKRSHGTKTELEAAAKQIISLSQKDIKSSSLKVLQRKASDYESKTCDTRSSEKDNCSGIQSQVQDPRMRMKETSKTSDVNIRSSNKSSNIEPTKDFSKHNKSSSSKQGVFNKSLESTKSIPKLEKKKPSITPSKSVKDKSNPSPKKGFSCGECHHSFYSFVDLEIHVNEKHTNVKTINKIDINPHNSIRVDRSKPKLVKKPILSHFTKIDTTTIVSTSNPDRIKVHYPKKIMDADKEKNKASLNAASKEGFGNKSSDKLKADMTKLLAKSEHHTQQKKEPNKKVPNALFTKEGITKVKDTIQKSVNHQEERISSQPKKSEHSDNKHTKSHSEKHTDSEQQRSKDLKLLKEAHRKRLKMKKKKKRKQLEEEVEKNLKHRHKHIKASSESPRKQVKQIGPLNSDNQQNIKEASRGMTEILDNKILSHDGITDQAPNPLLDDLTQIVTGKRQSKLTQRKKAFMEALQARQTRRRKLKDFTLDTDDTTVQKSSTHKLKVMKSSNIIKAKEVIMKSKKVQRVLQNEKLAKTQKDMNNLVEKSIATVFSPVSVVRAIEKTKRIALHQQVESVFKVTGNQLQQATQQPVKTTTTTSSTTKNDATDKLSLGQTSLSEQQLENIFNRVHNKHLVTSSTASSPVMIDTDSAIPSKGSPKGLSTRCKSSTTSDEDDNTTIKALKYKIDQAEKTARKLIRKQRKGSDDNKASGGPLKVKLHIKMADFVSETTALLTSDITQTYPAENNEEELEKSGKGSNKKGKKRKGGKRKIPSTNSKAAVNIENKTTNQQPKRKRSRYYVYEDELLAQNQRQIFDDSHDSGVGSFSGSIIDNLSPNNEFYENDLYAFPEDLEYDNDFDYGKQKEEKVYLTADVLLSSLLTLADVDLDEQNVKDMEDACDRETRKDVTKKLDQILDKISGDLEGFDISKGYRQLPPMEDDIKVAKNVLEELVIRVDEAFMEETSTSAKKQLELDMKTVQNEGDKMYTPPPSPDHEYFKFKQHLLTSCMKIGDGKSKIDYSNNNSRNNMSNNNRDNVWNNNIGSTEKLDSYGDTSIHFCREGQNHKTDRTTEFGRRSLPSTYISSMKPISEEEGSNERMVDSQIMMQENENLSVDLFKTGYVENSVQATMGDLLDKVVNQESLRDLKPFVDVQRKNDPVCTNELPLAISSPTEENVVQELLQEICDFVTCETTTAANNTLHLIPSKNSMTKQNLAGSKEVELIIKDLLSDMVHVAIDSTNKEKNGDYNVLFMDKHNISDNIRTITEKPETIRQPVKRTSEDENNIQPNKFVKLENIDDEYSNLNVEISSISTNKYENMDEKDDENNIVLKDTPTTKGILELHSPLKPKSAKHVPDPSPEELEKIEEKKQRILLSHQKNVDYIADNIQIKTEPIDYHEVDVQVLAHDNISVTDQFQLDLFVLQQSQNFENSSATLTSRSSKTQTTVTSPEQSDAVMTTMLINHQETPAAKVAAPRQLKSYSCDKLYYSGNSCGDAETRSETSVELRSTPDRDVEMENFSLHDFPSSISLNNGYLCDTNSVVNMLKNEKKSRHIINNVKNKDQIQIRNEYLQQTDTVLCKNNNMFAENQFFNCTFCSLCFKSSDSMKFHMISQHNDTLRDQNIHFKCKTCMQKFVSKKLLIRHTLLRHSKTNDCKCNICGQTFLRPSYLKSHQKSQHRKMKLSTI